MKDNFSTRSDNYAKYRPQYPSSLFDFLNSIVSGKENAWDCGTGNGQVAIRLADSFSTVWASDLSQAQIDQAFQTPNIRYSVKRAEKTNFPNQFFDLVTVAQAIHWFDFDKFYEEVKRTSKPKAIICVLGYGLLNISPEIDELVSDFYDNTIGSFWDPERKYLDEGYQTIPFPFQEISCPKFESVQSWDLNHFIGYLNTWSAIKHFIRENGFNPLPSFQLKLEKHWKKDEVKQVSFPLLLRVGKVFPEE